MYVCLCYCVKLTLFLSVIVFVYMPLLWWMHSSCFLTADNSLSRTLQDVNVFIIIAMIAGVDSQPRSP